MCGMDVQMTMSVYVILVCKQLHDNNIVILHIQSARRVITSQTYGTVRCGAFSSPSTCLLYKQLCVTGCSQWDLSPVRNYQYVDVPAPTSTVHRIHSYHRRSSAAGWLKPMFATRLLLHPVKNWHSLHKKKATSSKHTFCLPIWYICSFR